MISIESLQSAKMRAFLLLTVFTALVTAKQCDRETECDDDATCCLLANKEWGCCPMKNAVCCEDHLHCCPEGSQCDVSAARCINQFSVSHLMKKKKARKIMVRQDPYNEEVICPDKISKCPQDTTCCLLEQGLYGCCPAPNATCCIDQLHCCPHGTRCEAGSCVSTLTGHRTKHLKNFSSTPLSQDDEVVLLENFGKGERDEGKSAMMKKKSARKVSFVNVHNEIICPDKVSKCPQSTTCCAISEGSYGCCPAPEAVCCEDKMHCCPHNTRCHKDMCINTLTGHRSHHLKKFKSTSLHRSPASSFYRENSDESSEEDETGVVICGYEKSCPIGNTCCKVPTEDGRLRHACCPFANGVCCEDSCCPNGFHCVKGRKCEKQARSFKHTFFDNIL